MNPQLSAMPRAACTVLTTTILAAFGSAQASTDAGPSSAATVANDVAQTIRVPIHTAAPAYGMEYGVWAAGPNYKVSFHDGFAFYPVLGSDYPENLPLRWRTESVTVGGEPVFAAGAEPETAHTDWRFEYRYEGLVEAYDVRTDGVEQTFTLMRRPKKRGDLVVVGRLASRLRAAEVPMSHAAVSFQGPKGEAILRYGEAFALDARGVKAPMQTACDGERITLRVPDAWLRRATFPVTIDPLMSPLALSGRSTRPFLQVDLSTLRNDNGKAYAAYSLSVSASDSDAYLVKIDRRLVTPDPVVMFSDLTSSWKTPAVAVACVYSSSWYRVVLGMQRDFAPPGLDPTSGIAWHVSSGSGFSTVSTDLVHSSVARRRPDVGGAYRSRMQADFVWEQDIATGGANTPYTEVYKASLDPYMSLGPLNGSLGTPTRVAASPSANGWDREFPSISEASEVIAYQERPSAGGLHTVQLVWKQDGIRATIGTSRSAAYPKVGGAETRFLVAYRDGSRCKIRSIDRDYTHGTAIIGAPKTLSFAGYPGAVAFDTDTGSHFCVTVSGRSETESSSQYSQNHFYRLGHTLGIVEQGFLGYGGTAATTPATYVPEYAHPDRGFDGHFVLAHQRHTNVAGRDDYSLLDFKLEHDAAAGNFLYGTGCAGTISSPTKPYAGRSSYRVDLSGASQTGWTAWLYVSRGSDLVYVNPGCYLNIDGNHLIALHARTISAAGSAFVTFDLPDDPVWLGNYYMQWVWSNQKGTWYSTKGLRAQARL